MEQVHKTTMDDVPYALCPFQGKVLVGVGKLLRLYDIGKKKLLRKSENKVKILTLVMKFMRYHDEIFSPRDLL